MDSTEIDDIRWLIANANLELDVPGLSDDPLRLAAHFRAHHSANRTRLLCELHELRIRARAKFTSANRMFFTRLGYEQSTDELIADYKSRRFSHCDSVCDLCCGIGGDAISLGKNSGYLTLVDRSKVKIELARANLQANDIVDYQVREADVRSVDLSSFTAWHLDPDRRADQKRRTRPDACEPPLHQFLGQLGRSRNGAVKLSPAADVSYLLDENVELEWIGHSRECQQLVIWLGELADYPGKRTASWLTRRDGALHVEKIAGDRAAVDEAVLRDMPRFLYEPRPSVIAAGLASALATKFTLRRIAKDVAYFGSNELLDSYLFQRFETLATFPYRQKTLASKLSQLGGWIAEVKKRRVDDFPAHTLSKQARPDGQPLVLLLFPVKHSVHAVLAKRIT